jgi:hypothetical protein
MLSYIDHKLIGTAQWAVRQIELFTSHTRQDALVFVLMLFRYIIAGESVWTFLSFLSEDGLAGTVMAVVSVCVPFAIIYQILAMKIEEKEKPGVLPACIVERAGLRKGFFCLLTVHSVVIAVLNLLGEGVGNLISFLPVLFYCPMALEYLMCTTSLPPGEKDRKKQEREARNMAPEGA